MDDNRFWELIANVRLEDLAEGDEESAVEPLREALERLPSQEIEAFEEALARHLYALDGRVFAEAAGESGGSDDGFLYARCYVVASGRQRFEAVRSNPEEMPKLLDEWCEALLGVASAAYENSTGATWEFAACVSYETGSNSALWP